MASLSRPGIATAVRGPLERRDLPGLYMRMCALLSESRGSIVTCDVAEIAVDAVAVEALARLQLGARRNACVVRLRNASPELVELVSFLGLGDVLPA